MTDGQCVPGAKLTIKDSAQNTLLTWTSTCGESDGTDGYTIPVCLTAEEQEEFGDTTCIRPGNYTLTEEIPPKGYATAETISFTVANDGKINTKTDMKDAPIEVCIYKVKKGTKEVLTGAEFEIYEKGKDEPFTTIVSSKEPCIPYFPVGEYTIKETKAPDGYKISNETVDIVVEDKAGHQDFYIEDEVVAPKTAMDYSITAIIIASIFMMFGLGMVGYYEYKKGH